MKVIIGAGEQNWDGWIATQGDELNLLDEGSWKRFFGNAKAETLLCEHVYEHLTFEEGKIAAKIIYRYLRPGGFIRVAVPDRHFPDEEHQRDVQVGGPGLGDHPAADQKWYMVTGNWLRSSKKRDLKFGYSNITTKKESSS